MQTVSAMLADAADVHAGKLYIHGGGWNTIYAAQVPATHPLLALVVVFRLDWHEANETIPLEVDLADEDEQQTLLTGKGELRIAPAPQATKGEALYQPFVQQFAGLQFPALGFYRFRLGTGDAELVRLPIRIASSAIGASLPAPPGGFPGNL